MDLPTYLEANVITTTAIKVAWVFCYILVYGLRPVIVRPKKVGAPHVTHSRLAAGCLSCSRLTAFMRANCGWMHALYGTWSCFGVCISLVRTFAVCVAVIWPL